MDVCNFITLENTRQIRRVGQNHIYTYIQYIYGDFGRDFIKYTVIYGQYIYGSSQPYKHVSSNHQQGRNDHLPRNAP